MTERLIEKLDRLASEAGIKNVTPEIRKFAMLVREDVVAQWPQRPWVGLTDEEIDQGLLRSNHALQTAGAWRDGVEWATKQLKEKNT